MVALSRVDHAERSTDPPQPDASLPPGGTSRPSSAVSTGQSPECSSAIGAVFGHPSPRPVDVGKHRPSRSDRDALLVRRVWTLGSTTRATGLGIPLVEKRHVTLCRVMVPRTYGSSHLSDPTDIEASRDVTTPFPRSVRATIVSIRQRRRSHPHLRARP